MKNRTIWKWGVGLALAALPLAGGCLQQQASSAPEPPATISQSEALPPSVVQPIGGSAATGEVAQAEISTAPAKPVASEKSLPASIRPESPLAQVVRLAESGVEESVMLAFVTNSSSTFNLGAEEIIYLNDIGVPGPVVTAMLQHDQTLKEGSVNVAASGTAPPVAQAPPPAPAEVAPQPAPEAVPAPESYAPPVAATSPVFYDSLAPYGTWVDIEGYGRCWQPTVVVGNPGWRPYFDCGRWIYSDCGWYWYSDYSWGWAPFHYGRWFRHYRLGWCWAPDTCWGPSWVSWRYSNDYCGWAPLPPAACFTPGFGFTYFGHSVGFSFSFGLGVDCFAFIPFNHFRDHHLHRFAVPRDRVVNIYNKTTVVTKIVGNNNTVINNGISAERVAAATRSEVRKVSLHEVRSPAPGAIRHERLSGDGKALTVFRPNLPQSTTTRTALVGSSGGGTRTANTTVLPGTARNTLTQPASRSLAGDPSTAPKSTPPRLEQPSSSSKTTEMPPLSRQVPQVPRNRTGSSPERLRSPALRVPPASDTEHVVTAGPSASEPVVGSTRSRPATKSDPVVSRNAERRSLAPAAQPAPSTTPVGRTPPLIVRGSSRSTPEPRTANTTPSVNTPTRSTVPPLAMNQNPSPSTARSAPAPTRSPWAPRSESSYRQEPNYRSETTRTWLREENRNNAPTPSQSQRQFVAPQRIEPPAYQAPRQYEVPRYQPPVQREVPRYQAPAVERPRFEAPQRSFSPAPSYSPPPQHSYSPPAASYRSAPSAPPASAPSAPASSGSRSEHSSGRNPR